MIAFMKNKACHLKENIRSLETEKRPIKIMFKNAFLKENFKNWSHWSCIHITLTDNI